MNLEDETEAMQDIESPCSPSYDDTAKWNANYVHKSYGRGFDVSPEQQAKYEADRAREQAEYRAREAAERAEQRRLTALHLAVAHTAGSRGAAAYDVIDDANRFHDFLQGPVDATPADDIPF